MIVRDVGFRWHGGQSGGLQLSGAVTANVLNARELVTLLRASGVHLGTKQRRVLGMAYAFLCLRECGSLAQLSKYQDMFFPETDDEAVLQDVESGFASIEWAIFPVRPDYARSLSAAFSVVVHELAKLEGPGAV